MFQTTKQGTITRTENRIWKCGHFGRKCEGCLGFISRFQSSPQKEPCVENMICNQSRRNPPSSPILTVQSSIFSAVRPTALMIYAIQFPNPQLSNDENKKHICEHFLRLTFHNVSVVFSKSNMTFTFICQPQ